MKSTLLVVALLASISSNADVCQIKPSESPQGEAVNQNINIWSLKKGDQTVGQYTFYDVDLEKGISDRDALVKESLCEPEAVLEKCSTDLKTKKYEDGVSRITVEVKIGPKTAAVFGNLPYLDQYSLDKAHELVDKLDAAHVCEK